MTGEPFLGQSLGDFLERLAAEEPTPGGGGATAVTTAMAAGLLAMSVRFSRTQLPDAEQRAARADRVRADVIALGPRDAEAYGAVLAALRSPKDTPGRRDSIREALDAAARVPLQIAEAAAGVATEAADVAERGNPNLRGDALAAVDLARAAGRAAAALVRINVELGGLEQELADRADAAVRAAGA